MKPTPHNNNKILRKIKKIFLLRFQMGWKENFPIKKEKGQRDSRGSPKKFKKICYFFI
jgi:hypothetical protein